MISAIAVLVFLVLAQKEDLALPVLTAILGFAGGYGIGKNKGRQE